MNPIAGKLDAILGVDVDGLVSNSAKVITQGNTLGEKGKAVHDTWQGLAGVYIAPEAPELFAATEPIAGFSAVLQNESVAIGNAVNAFAEVVRQLQIEARALLAAADEASAETDRQLANPSPVEGETMGALVGGVIHDTKFEEQAAALLERFDRAQVDCVAKFAMFSGGDLPVFTNGDGITDPGELGMTARDFLNSWGGTSMERTPYGGIAKAFQGNIDGLKSLATEEGWQDLANFGISAAIMLFPPTALLNESIPIAGVPVGGARETITNAGKGFLAWDDWATNPGNAFGQVLYNFGTLGLGFTKIGALPRLGSAARTGLGAVGAALKLPDSAALAAKIADLKVPTLIPVRGPAVADGLAPRLPELGSTRFGDTPLGQKLLGPDRVDNVHDSSAGGSPPQNNRVDAHFDPPEQSRPNTPHNDPALDKNDPTERAKIQDQVDEIRAQVQDRFDVSARDAWDEVERRWGTDLRERYARAIDEKGKPDHLFKGTETHTRWERDIQAALDELIDPDSGYRIRVEVSFDKAGTEVPRGREGSVRPDAILEREVWKTADDGQRVLDWEAVHVWDLKTGQAVIENPWARKVNDRLDPVTTPETINPTLPRGDLPPVNRR